MKKVFFLLVVLFQAPMAFPQSESTTFKIKVDEEMVTYLFDSLKDFEENYEKYLDDFEIKEEKKRKKAEESFWVEISIIIRSEKESTIITRSINSSGIRIKEDTIKLKGQVFSLLAVL